MTKYTKEQIDLQNHIISENKKAQSWIDVDPKNRWHSMITTDLNHWAKNNIFNVADYNKYMSANALYEIFSDKYCKSYARSMDFFSMSQEELDAIYDDEKAREKRKQERKANEAVENLVNNKILAESLGVTIEDLERWEVAY